MLSFVDNAATALSWTIDSQSSQPYRSFQLLSAITAPNTAVDFTSSLSWGERLFKVRRAASPAPSAAQLTDVGSSDQGNAKHGSKTHSIATESCVPPSLSAADAQATRPSTDAIAATDPHPPAGASPAPPLAPLVEPPPKPGVTEYTEQPTTVLSASERLWNAAYDSLETDNAKYVGSYVEILEKVLGGETREPAADLSAKLKDPTSRQKYMKELAQKGQEKISKSSRITTGIGGIADFILSAKEMVDLVLQGVPQAAPAALPWAGVCLGLQILRNPAQATKSNLAGIAHVVSRMD
ncbi:hypothetical protein DL768_010749 [Monosporascus sp. mg162]|nr:hypothetical protein DL768_010749 [Monosporascus sp. mg162]